MFFIVFYFILEFVNESSEIIYFFLGAGTLTSFFSPPFGTRTEWMFGKTPPCAIVTPPNSLFNSSSLRTANWMCLGTMRFFLLSRAAFPANSKISAVKYSKIDAR